jgi:hypothetical protein
MNLKEMIIIQNRIAKPKNWVLAQDLKYALPIN